MSRTYRHDDKYKIEGQRKPKPDARRLSRALAKWVEAKREQEALSASPPKPQDQQRKEGRS